MKQDLVLDEARRLYDMGAAIHWLRPKSKIPLESGWGSGPRREFDYLCSTWNNSNNVGVRLGTPSRIGENYLAVIDVDVKSLDPRHKKEALSAARKLLLGHVAPTVSSGRGNGSCHYYVVTERPFKTFNPAQSSEVVKVHMPSKNRISKREKEELTDAELKQGLRLAHAWEISLYSDGRQVVLPPSLHPDSGRAYKWVSPWENEKALPLIQFEIPNETGKNQVQSRERGAQETVEDFAVTTVNLDWLDIPKSIALLIKKGLWKGATITNRSDYLLVATTGLVSASCTRDDILTVLTEPDYFLGEVAYEHAQTKSRKRAAQWLWNYTVKKVMNERDARQVFLDAADPMPPATLSGKAAKAQAEELERETPWRQHLETTKEGKVRSTLNNCKLILTKACALPGFVGRNEFAANDYYLCDSPWRSVKNDAVTDADIHRIKFYCAEQFGVEFPDTIINQTLMDVADYNRFHPVRNWLKSLKWDGVKRIDHWLVDHAGAVGPKAYLEDVSRKVLVAMVKRVFEPGCKFDFVLILEGLQGVGKSTMLRNLACDAWFSDAPLVIGDKDAVLTMQSKWLIELGELSTMRKAETEQLKAFITQTTDRIRAPYGKRVEEFPRQCIFIGSTNNEEYLPDLTGNRRFWPIKVTAIHFGEVAKVRDQLFAEAVAVYNMGEPLYLEDAATAELAVGEQAKRQQSDEWLSTVDAIVSGEIFPIKRFEIRDVAKMMTETGAHRLSPYDSQRITRCLTQLGFESFRDSTGDRRRLWRLKEDVQRRPVPSSGALDVTNGKESEANMDFY